MKPTLTDFLQNTTAFITPQIAEEIAAQFSPCGFAKNEYFLKAGRVSSRYLFLEEGFMRAFAYNTEGDEVTTNFYSAGQVVFEVSSFFNHTPSLENIQTLTDCRGWFINFEQLNALFHNLPQFREFGRSVLVKGFAALKTRMLSQITETAEERYMRLMQTAPDVFLHAPLKYIASYLGITDTSLSRIRKELQNK